MSNEARQATPAERKQQLAQLAAMGVAVPEDFRREMAMAGDWQTVSERPVNEAMKEEDLKDIKASAPDIGPAAVNIGVRKRKYEGQEEEEEAGERVVKKGWGSTLRTYAGADEETDLDALLDGTKTASHKATIQASTAISSCGVIGGDASDVARADSEQSPAAPLIKKEESNQPSDAYSLRDSTDTAPSKTEELSAGIVFKKRRPKQMRQK